MSALTDSLCAHRSKLIDGRRTWVKTQNGKWCHATREETLTAIKMLSRIIETRLNY